MVDKLKSVADSIGATELPEIIHVVRQYTPAIGGLENFVKALAEQQVKMGLEVTVITLNRNFSTGEKYPEDEIINGVKIKRISFIGSKRYPIAPSVLKWLNKGSLVHVHCTDFFSDYLAITKLIHGCILVLSTHGGFFHTKFASTGKTLFFNTITRLSLRAYRKVFACSVGDFDRFTSISKKVTLIENGVEIERFKNLTDTAIERENKAVFIGRFSSNKRIDHLLDRYISVLKQIPDASLTIVGNDYDGLAVGYRKRISEAGVNGTIDIKEGMSDIELKTLMLESRYIVSASEYEGFGMTVIEGMAAGLIPLVNDIPSFAKIVREAKAGLVCDFANSKTDDEIIEYINYSKNHIQEMQSAVIEYANNYSWNSVERKFHTEYCSLLGLRERHIQGVKIVNATKEEALDTIIDFIDSSKYTQLVYANAHSINVAKRDNAYKNILNNSLVLPDGIGVDIASKIKYGKKFKDNLNGTDFTPELFSHIKSSRIFIIGSKPGVADRVKEKWQIKYPQHEWVGSCHGYISANESLDIVEVIKALHTDILIVAMGNPLQEKWIAQYCPSAKIKLAIAVGALLDFTDGQVSRAPEKIRHLRLEWVYRLVAEPRRMARRYIIGNFIFLLRACNDRSY